VTGKRLVQRLVDEVIDSRDWARLSGLCTPELAPKLDKAFTEFHRAFPDWHQEILEMVEEGETVVARFRCSGTQRGEWQGIAPRSRRMRIDEVYFFRVTAGRLSGLWGLEDTWTRMRQLAGEDAVLGELGSLS
jgi:predicted ester cyclase